MKKNIFFPYVEEASDKLFRFNAGGKKRQVLLALILRE